MSRLIVENESDSEEEFCQIKEDYFSALRRAEKALKEATSLAENLTLQSGDKADTMEYLSHLEDFIYENKQQWRSSSYEC